MTTRLLRARLERQQEAKNTMRAQDEPAHEVDAATAPDVPRCIPDVPLPCPGCGPAVEAEHAANDTLDVGQNPDTEEPARLIDAAAAYAHGVRQWLTARGLDPDSSDLTDTPHRVLRALNEMTAGYDQDPAEHLARTFDVDHNGGTIVVTGVPFSSLCAHHLLPFTGHADIAYQPRPGAPVAGLSKLPRVLDVYARRLQTQEELTAQVTSALDQHLEPAGSACIIRSEHGCLAHRGARKPGAVMVTASYTGIFRDDPQARADLHLLMNG